MSESNGYDTPAAAGGNIQWADIENSLVLIKPTNYETGISTSYGDRDAVRANITVLDGPQQGVEYDDAMVWPKVLVSQLKSKVGRKVLGRVGKGVAKKGQSAPWVLDDPTPDDIQRAKAYEGKQNPFDTATAAPPF